LRSSGGAWQLDLSWDVGSLCSRIHEKSSLSDRQTDQSARRYRPVGPEGTSVITRYQCIPVPELAVDGGLGFLSFLQPPDGPP
jgi:hypothetical protein